MLRFAHMFSSYDTDMLLNSSFDVKVNWLQTGYQMNQPQGGYLRGRVRPVKMSQNGPFSLPVVCRPFRFDKNESVHYLELVFRDIYSQYFKVSMLNVFNYSM